jgi:osmotically-inducible protein OsmY
VVDDKQLQESVIAALRSTPGVDAADLGVQAEGGIVTLTGHVPAPAQKANARRAASGVAGVRAVADDIVVRPDGDPASDEDIARRAMLVLRWDATVPRDVRLSVDHGRITLEGDVDFEYQRTNCEIDLRRIADVVSIVNRIAVRPSAHADAVREAIATALRRDAELEAGRVTIEVHDGHHVTLRGTATSDAERDAIERAAKSAPGVSSVRNVIEVEIPRIGRSP